MQKKKKIDVEFIVEKNNRMDEHERGENSNTKNSNEKRKCFFF